MAILYMLPRITLQNNAYIGLGNTKFISNSLLGEFATQRSYFQHVCLGYLGVSMFGSLGAFAAKVTVRVQSIFRCGAILQILKEVVERVTILVIDLCFRVSRAYKRMHNHPMYGPHEQVRAYVQPNTQIPLSIILAKQPGGFFGVILSIWRSYFNPSIVTNFVVFKPRYSFPSLHLPNIANSGGIWL